MKKPRLIMIYGFAGLGKTTLAKKLNTDIALSLCIEVDELLTMIGQWLPNETVARKYVYSITKSMIDTYIKLGHDVIVPYLLTDKNHAIELEAIANNHGADFFELYIRSNKEESIKYIYERGTWGEADAPPITQADLPHIKQTYADMEKAMSTRLNVIEIPYIRGDIAKTYNEMVIILNKVTLENTDSSRL